MKVNGQLLEARADAAALLQPADALLDHGTLAIVRSSNFTAGVHRAASESL